MDKTNVMRLLEQRKIKYTPHEYAHGEEAVDGLRAAELTGLAPERVFKTLVARGASKKIFVFVIPASMELDLKKAAKAAGEKSVELVPVKEINSLTGYVRGGCSPIGMKKQYKTFYHHSLAELGSLAVSAGRIGYQVELSPAELLKITAGTTADIAEG